MMKSVKSALPAEERRLNLLKDGGRLVMNGGDPYEDDLEPEAPAAPPGASRGACERGEQ
jgi:hypothetical protein